MIRSERERAQQRRGLGRAGSGLASLHMAGRPAGESFAVSRNLLGLRGAGLAGSARPQVIKHQKTEKKQNTIHLTVKYVPVHITS